VAVGWEYEEGDSVCKVFERGFKMDGKKGTMQCMQIGPASGLALILIVARETPVLKWQFAYSE
jgi:hypothetical protein